MSEFSIPPEPWMDGASCRSTEPDLFFPEGNGQPDAAKRICNGCDVRLQCLAYALRNDEKHGIWGGTTGQQRARMRKVAA